MQIATNKKEIYRTYEVMCLEKLKEIGISTASEWAAAMGYEHHSSLAKVIKRIQVQYPGRLVVYNSRPPKKYMAV